MIKSDPKHPQIQCQHLPRAPEPARTPGLEPQRDRMRASHAPGVLGCLYSTTRMFRRRHACSTCVPGLRRLEPPSYRTPWPSSALQDPRKPPIWALVTASRLCVQSTHAPSQRLLHCVLMALSAWAELIHPCPRLGRRCRRRCSCLGRASLELALLANANPDAVMSQGMDQRAPKRSGGARGLVHHVSRPPAPRHRTGGRCCTQ